MNATWTDEVSPYDVLGVGAEATEGEIRRAFFEQAKLFHPDRNGGESAETTEARTGHFLRVKKAYEVLSDAGSRRNYDACLVQREKLVRKNFYKYAVSNASEFRDVVDEQFREAVLDPEVEIGPEALVLCCESCGAPSKFRCATCDMLTCAFCALKPHASDDVPPHYPSKYSPSFRRKMEAAGRRKRLTHSAQERRAAQAVFQPSEQRTRDARRLRRRLAARAEIDDAKGRAARAELGLGYAFVQTHGRVYVAAWLPFDTDLLDVDLSADRMLKLTSRLALGNRDRDRPAADGRKLWGPVDRYRDTKVAAFPGNRVVVIRFLKLVPGLRWPAAFQGDSDRCRDAGDHDRHDWREDDEDDDTTLADPGRRAVVVDVQVPHGLQVTDLNVALSPRVLSVDVVDFTSSSHNQQTVGKVPRKSTDERNIGSSSSGCKNDDDDDDDALRPCCLLAPWVRTLKHAALVDAATWCLVPEDGRLLVRIFLTLVNCPIKVEAGKIQVAPLGNHLFVEDADDHHTLAMAQLAAYLDLGAALMPRDDLLPDARAALKGLELERRRGSTGPVPSLFDEPDQGEEEEQEKPEEDTRRWYARAVLRDEAAWRQAFSSSRPTPLPDPFRTEKDDAATDKKTDNPPSFAHLPAPPGVRGPPKILLDTVHATTPPDENDDVTKLKTCCLFPDASGLERRDLAAFAWEDDGPVVKVYLNLKATVDALTKNDVAVRFEKRALTVQVKHAPANLLLGFNRPLFDFVVPKKSTLKIHAPKRTIIITLHKKNPDKLWHTLAHDINSPDAVSPPVVVDRADPLAAPAPAAPLSPPEPLLAGGAAAENIPAAVPVC